jgi:transcriptional regulator of acetoin/glycerol metabolism
MRDRDKPGTLAHLARRILDGERSYAGTEKTLRALCLLEAIVREGGNQRAAARTLGLSRETVRRDMRQFGFDGQTLRALAMHIKKSGAL